MNQDLTALNAISPIDGRYKEKTEELSKYSSEFALIRTRLMLEVKYLQELSKIGITRKLTPEENKILENLIENFSIEDAKRIKEIEKTTNHDIKSIEFFLREFFAKSSLSDLSEYIHFALTSEDISNLSFRLLIKDAVIKVILPRLEELLGDLNKKSKEYKDLVILGRTHGQPAIPTTLGKEIAIFASRIEKELRLLKQHKLSGKLNGAIGNFSSLYVAFPKVNWPSFSKKFIESLELEYSPLTNQINDFGDVIYLFQCFQRINGVLIDLDQDFWRYISDNWLSQENKKGEVGSSTMPQKINPIDFENSEGNLFLANGLIEVFSAKLPLSRLQRDLSNSTIIRNSGTILAYCLISYTSTQKSLGKVKPNLEKISDDLNSDWSILSEAVQTILRREKVENAYDVIKNSTRGQKITKSQWITLIDSLPVSNEIKAEIKKITPENYIGLAKELV